MMRGKSHDDMASDLLLDARDMILEVKGLKPEERKTILNDLIGARVLLSAAIVECMK
jgi:hypothetical protein